MTRKQKCHVLTLSGLLIGIIFIVNIYFLHVISSEPVSGRKSSTQLNQTPIKTISDKFIPAYSNVNTNFYSIFYELKRQLTLKKNDNISISTIWTAAKQVITFPRVFYLCFVNMEIINGTRQLITVAFGWVHIFHNRPTLCQCSGSPQELENNSC